jgi:phosphate transport system substrate-binding protein
LLAAGLIGAGCLGALPLALPAAAQAQAAANPEASTKANGINIVGSSTVYPFSLEAIRQFDPRARQGQKISATATGTSAGLREFCAGRISIAAASRPINAKELKACESKGISFLELPLAFDAITVVVNPANPFAKAISTAQLQTLWSRAAEGKVKRWSQVNPSWPDEAIRLCGPGRESGTYDTFNKAISGDEANSRQDYTASEDDNVLVRCVAKDRLALGYFGFDYYQANRSRLRALTVDGLRGPVAPSVKAVQDSRYLPLSRPLFYYVNAKAVNSNPTLRQFVSNSLQKGRKIAEQAGMIPLQNSTYLLVTNKLYRNVQGSAFAGKLPIGLSVGQILQRSFDDQKQPQFR